MDGLFDYAVLVTKAAAYDAERQRADTARRHQSAEWLGAGVLGGRAAAGREHVWLLHKGTSGCAIYATHDAAMAAAATLTREHGIWIEEMEVLR